MRSSSVLLAVLVAAAMVLGSLAVASSGPAAAQGQACPAGSVPSADGSTCVPASGQSPDENVTTTTSCVQGVLSDDGLYCIVPRLDAAPAPAAATPADAVPVPRFTG